MTAASITVAWSPVQRQRRRRRLRRPSGGSARGLDRFDAVRGHVAPMRDDVHDRRSRLRRERQPLGRRQRPAHDGELPRHDGADGSHRSLRSRELERVLGLGQVAAVHRRERRRRLQRLPRRKLLRIDLGHLVHRRWAFLRHELRDRRRGLRRRRQPLGPLVVHRCRRAHARLRPPPPRPPTPPRRPLRPALPRPARRRRASRCAGMPRPTPPASPATACTGTATPAGSVALTNATFSGLDLRSQLHALGRRLRRERQPLEPQLRRLLDRTLPRHDASVDADRADADGLHRVDDRPRLGRVDRQRRRRRLRRLSRHASGSRRRARPATRSRRSVAGRPTRVGVDAYDAAGSRSARASLVVTTSSLRRRHPGAVRAAEPDASAAVTPTSFTMSWSAATDNVGVTGYGVYLNGTKVGTTTGDELHLHEPHVRDDLHGRARGARRSRQRVRRRVRDRACVDERVPAGADTQAPTAPAAVTLGAVSQTSAAVSWSASTDNVGVTGYGYYRGGSRIGNGTGDELHLLRPDLRHELHARDRRRRRGRQPLRGVVRDGDHERVPPRRRRRRLRVLGLRMCGWMRMVAPASGRRRRARTSSADACRLFADGVVGDGLRRHGPGQGGRLRPAGDHRQQDGADVHHRRGRRHDLGFHADLLWLPGRLGLCERELPEPEQHDDRCRLHARPVERVGDQRHERDLRPREPARFLCQPLSARPELHLECRQPRPGRRQRRPAQLQHGRW